MTSRNCVIASPAGVAAPTFVRIDVTSLLLNSFLLRLATVDLISVASASAVLVGSFPMSEMFFLIDRMSFPIQPRIDLIWSFLS